jgi:hypothetical protein
MAQEALKRLPKLQNDQHPILFGRIFGIRMCVSSSKSSRLKLIERMEQRLAQEPQLATELLYEPSVQSLVLQDSDLQQFVAAHAHLIHDIKFWYHFSQVSVHRVFQVSLLIRNKQYTKALSILENIPFGHIRHGYREFIEIYVAFFQMKIAQELNTKELDKWQTNFELRRKEINYPIFTDAYFENYFNN